MSLARQMLTPICYKKTSWVCTEYINILKKKKWLKKYCLLHMV